MTESTSAAAAASAIKRLEEQGEVAADYLEELLDIADLGGDIDIDVEHGRAVVAIVSDDPLERDLERLVGPGGDILEALQELTRIAVQTKTGERSRLLLDISGYRANRREELRAVAAEAVEEVKAKGVKLALEPMNAFERKMVHDAVAEAGLVSRSSGAEPTRYVVIQPASAEPAEPAEPAERAEPAEPAEPSAAAEPAAE
ncbi:MAG: single-stranded DNA-binding protein [Bifidobacteriaceae bacterium]|nr:single-stranded DNA-binding protein [Bifidobacteriaceae bacterium]